jgi:hypothetical protein
MMFMEYFPVMKKKHQINISPSRWGIFFAILSVKYTWYQI